MKIQRKGLSNAQRHSKNNVIHKNLLKKEISKRNYHYLWNNYGVIEESFYLIIILIPAAITYLYKGKKIYIQWSDIKKMFFNEKKITVIWKIYLVKILFFYRKKSTA